MTHTVIKSSTESHTTIYAVAYNGEAITNATHALVVAKQALDICKRRNITSYYPTNKLYLLDAMLAEEEGADDGNQTS